ncbi:MAG TPA: hypothetical protein VN802_22840 [Stellaceae bacterium]|nr:hypothetical protein [Stellaceae bacterium]
MPFEIIPPDDLLLTIDDNPADDEARETGSRQLALCLDDAPVYQVAPLPPRRGKPTLQDIQAHIQHLTGQLETLRRQLRDHPADRLAILLHEMISERERELERWLAQQQRWDERLTAIENAITERDAHRRREADLLRERDEARREAAITAARLEAAQRAADEARRQAQSLERVADKAKAEQLRVRHERELDKTSWLNERRHLATQVERLQDRGWLARIIRG